MVFGLTAAACALGHPTGHEVVDRSTPVICEKAKQCAGDAKFSRTYGSVDDCVAKTKAGVEAQRSDLDVVSAAKRLDVDRATASKQLDRYLERFGGR